MDFFRALLKGSLSLVLFSFVGNANALVVDFESTGISDIQNTYFDSNFNTTSLTTLNNVAFYLDGSMQVNAAGGIYFSEGVLLQKLTHQIIHFRFYHIQIDDSITIDDNLKAVPVDQLSQYAMPKSLRDFVSNLVDK